MEEASAENRVEMDRGRIVARGREVRKAVKKAVKKAVPKPSGEPKRRFRS